MMLEFESVERQIALLTPDEIFANASESLLTKLREDPRIERKPGGYHREPLATYISMWANTSPEGGIIALGINDDGTFAGCSEVSQDQLNWHDKVGREFCPDARYDTKRVECVRSTDQQPDFVVLIRVYYREDKVAETNKGEAYVRRGDSRYRLGDDEKRELAIDKGQVSFEQEPCGLKYPDEFDQAAIRDFASKVKEIKGLKTEYVPEQVLANRHLGKMQQGLFVPNMACALLFAKDPATVIPGSVIRFQRYEGTEKLTGEDRNVVKDVWIDGRVPEVIVKANDVLQSQVRTFSRLGRGGKFVTAPEYPQPAWYEAIVNACVHRSYSLRNMNIFIKMFDDRLVIESPGPFLPFVTPENIYDVHHRRNYFLMDAMFYMDFVKCENEGTRRMRDVMVASDLPAPEFEQKQIGNAFVRVTLRNNQSLRHEWIDKDATDIVGEAMDKLLSAKERRCINYVADHGKINVSEAQRLLGEKTWHAGRSVLQGLVTKGILEYVSKYDRDPVAHYRLKAPGKN
jgi:ATP-dependent DNA helicase RecG